MGVSKEFPLYLPNRRKGILLIPSPMTPEEFRLLQMQIDGAIDIARQLWIVEESPLPTDAERPDRDHSSQVTDARPDRGAADAGEERGEL